MSPWSAFPLVRISLAFIGGILAAYYGEAHYWIAIVGLGLCLVAYLLIIIFLPRPAFYQLSPWLGLLGLGCIFLLGYCYLLTHQERYAPDSLMHQPHAIKAYRATAIEDAQEKENSRSVIAVITQARTSEQWQPLQGKVRLYMPKSCLAEIRYGDVLLVLGQPQAIAAPMNPHEFDYQALLRRDNLYYQHFIRSASIAKLYNAPPNYFKDLLLKVRWYCIRILTKYIHEKREQAIVLALVLGLKDELDLVTKAAYASAGTMHVLAVSGLHVGILYGLLSVLLGGARNARPTRWGRAIIILAALWLYACITGLAPAVLRATMMFSFVVMARLLGRTSNSYNALAGAAFVLLLGNPCLIFSVGFQLSYLAVLGIVYLQPKIYRWVKLHNWLLQQLWRWTAVSLAAQLATTPISLYYFRQFPTYFLVANWVVVPAAFLMLSLGLGVLLTSCWTDLSMLLAWLLEQITWLVNQFVGWISNLPGSLLADIYLATPSLLLWYTLLIVLLIFLQIKKFPYLLIAGGVALSLCVRATQALLQQQTQQGVVFYSINGHQVVSFIKGPTSMLCTDDRFPTQEKKYAYHVKPSQLAMGIRNSTRYNFKEAAGALAFPLQLWAGFKVGVWGQKKFIFMDKAPSHWPCFAQKVHTDFLVIEANALTSLKPLLNQFEVGTLIIGASNQKQLALQLKAAADQLNLNCHSLHQQGAFLTFW